MVEIILFWSFWTMAAIANSLTDWYGFTKRGNDYLRKYKKPLEPAPLNLYYKLAGISFKERFPLSATILVFLTDKFHFYQFLQTSCVVASILLRPTDFTWVTLGMLIAIWGLVTHVSFILITHKNR